MQCVSLDAVTNIEIKWCISTTLRVDPELQCAGAHFVPWVVFKLPVNVSFTLYDVVNCKNQRAMVLASPPDYHKHSKYQGRGGKAK